MCFLSASARRLHKRTVVFGDDRRAQASIFPFFDRNGEVHELLIVDWDSGILLRAPWEPDLVRVPFFGPIRIASSWTRLRAVDVNDAGLLPLRWHFDPWWVLKDELFSAHPSTATLKATNCVPRMDQGTTALLFQRDLGAIRSVVRKGANRAGFEPWDPERLPAHPPEAAPERPGTRDRSEGLVHWALVPAWGGSVEA